MRAVELTERSVAGLTFVELPTPIPRHGEVLVRIRAASLNYRDYAVAAGIYQTSIPLPFVPLSDASGEVVQVGSGVAGFAPGDRVTTHYTVDWTDGAFKESYQLRKLGGMLPGVLQEYVALPVSALVRTPAGLSDEESSTLPIAALTAWNSIEELALEPGEWLLTQGTGSVSLFALQFAKLRGLKVIATTSKASKADILRRLDADHVVVSAGDPQWGARIHALADDEGVAGALDVGGNVTLLQTLAALRAEGRVAVVGFLGGFDDPPDLVLPLISKRARLFGQSVGSRASFKAMNLTIEASGLKPIIGSRFALEEVRAAFDLMGSGQAIGKIVVRL